MWVYFYNLQRTSSSEVIYFSQILVMFAARVHNRQTNMFERSLQVILEFMLYKLIKTLHMIPICYIYYSNAEMCNLFINKVFMLRHIRSLSRTVERVLGHIRSLSRNVERVLGHIRSLPRTVKRVLRHTQSLSRTVERAGLERAYSDENRFSELNYSNAAFLLTVTATAL